MELITIICYLLRDLSFAPVDAADQFLCQVEQMYARGCDLVQGYVYAKPLVINATTQDGVLTVTLQFEETAS